MSEKPIILILHHDDMDGIASAAVINSLYNYSDSENDWDIRFQAVNYGKETFSLDELDEAHRIYMVDFTSEYMPVLAERYKNKLIWIDHHKTAMEKYPETWNDPTIKGIRSLEKAACELCWEHIAVSDCPMAIRYIGDRDMWEFELADTKAFCIGVNAIIKSPGDLLWNSLLDDFSDQILVQEMIRLGNALLIDQNSRIEKAFSRGVDFKFENLNARLVNTSTDISELGEYIYTKPEYDIAVMWQAIEDMVVFSLRSNSKDPNAPDCSILARKHGGGGHKNAAGFQIKGIDFPLFFFSVMGDKE